MDTAKIITFNVNSAEAYWRRQLLQDFLNHYRPDLALITETHFKTRRRNIVNGYQLFYVNRKAQKTGGGTAILVKNGISSDKNYFKI